ncbi:MAG: glycogen debranching enzyme, partial [Candidatus Nanopelagicales bacterium]|nr:glycogen debranching enzyme [Candidatus Nanopelagicales bacterium]
MSAAERTGYSLGVTPRNDGSVDVAVWAPAADTVHFCSLGTAAPGSGETRHLLTRTTHGIHSGRVPDIPVGSHYGFRVTGEWNPSAGMRFNPNKFLLDPYARRITGELVNDPALRDCDPHDPTKMSHHDSREFVPHSVVTESTFDWGGDQPPHIPWSETIIYEAHVKGLTKSHPSVPVEDQGTFRGVASPAIIEHLRHIGVTAIELLPIHSFLSEEHLMETGLTNYWGYNSIGFFAPHHAYASRPGTEIEDFKY